MPFIVKQRDQYQFDVVEERGVHERVVESHPLQAMAEARMRELNAVRAQETMGTAGTFRMGSDARAPEGCTCVGGMRLEAVPCPVHG